MYPDHIKLGTGKKGLDAGYNESTCGLEGKLADEEPYLRLGNRMRRIGTISISYRFVSF